jgi:hypothetical protein
MPTIPIIADTPYFVLMDGKHRIGPSVRPLPSGMVCSPIYGFSDKAPYDRFCMNSELALVPYPLVKGYLRNKVEATGRGREFVVIDAAGPRAPCLNAATMEAVLEAQEQRTPQVTAAFRLEFDPETNAYSLKEAPA